MILIALLLALAPEAKATLTQEGINVASVHTGIQNSNESRSQSISADITGHVLTITFNDNVGHYY